MLRARFTFVLAGLGLIAALTPALNAEIIWDFGNAPDPLDYPTIAEVNAAGGLRVGDKVFSDFSVTPTSLSNGLVPWLAPDATSIKLQGLSMSGELGIGFSGLWQAIGGTYVDTVIKFKVVADAPSLITDNTLGMQGYLADNGGSVTISENVYAADPDAVAVASIAHKEVYHTDFASKEIDHQEFVDAFGAPLALPEIWIKKDVGVSGGPDDAGIASLSYFYQTFSHVPEPGTMLLLSIGGAVVAVRRRRR